LNEKKAHVLQKVHKLTNTFVKDKFPDEEHRLEKMWRQMEQSLLPLLVETHPREWTFEQPQITKAMAIVATEKQMPLPLSIVLVTLATMLESSDPGRLPTQEEVVSTVSMYGRKLKVIGQVLEELQTFLGEWIPRELQEIDRDISDRPIQELQNKRSNKQYEILIDGKKRICDLGEVETQREHKHSFTFWWDKEYGELLVNGKPKDLRPQLQILLSNTLEYDGRVLTNVEVGRFIWDDKEYGADRPYDALFSELFNATDHIINKQNVIARKGLKERRIKIDVHYCLIRPL